MFTDSQIKRYADVLLWGLETSRKDKTKKKDLVLIRCDLAAIKLAEVLYAKLLEMERYPLFRLAHTDNMEKIFYKASTNSQLSFIPPGEKELYSNLNGLIVLHAPESITHLNGIEPSRIAKTAIAKKPLRSILDKREETGDFSWTLCSYPTKAFAGHAKLTREAYAKQIVKACFLNKKNPVDHWRDIFDEAGTIKKWLNAMDARTIHVESANIDLEISLGEKRRWIGISGHNIPSFEIFISPDWRGTKGVYWANQPSFRSGNYTKGIRLEFNKGSVMKIQAEEGEEFTKNQLSMDKGADKLGEFSLTDKRFSKITRFMANTLFDENFGGRYGNCHIALGASYSDTFDGDPATLTQSIKRQLGFNDSALHWDIINTEKKSVWARTGSGKKVLIYENGCFKN